MPSRLGIQAIVPSLSRTGLAVQSKYDASFPVLGPKLWNVLPREITEITGADSFKNQLTKYLLSLPDEPPVPGYVRAHSNSLLEVARTGRQSPQ